MTRLDVEQSDVFVSWTSKDRELKNKVVEYLKSKNLKCLDSDESCCGDFVEWSKSSAEAASVFMLILTENTIDKILKDKQNNKQNYVLEEVHTVLKEWGADAINRIIVVCSNDEVYNHPVLWEDIQGASEGNLLRKEHLSVIYGIEFTDSKLEELFRKVTNLIIHRFIHKYNTAMSTNYIELVPLYKGLQKSPDRQFSFEDLYVPRTITEIGADGEVLAEFDSPKELVACGDILFLSGPGGSGKTQYLKLFFKLVNDDTVMISLPCFKTFHSEKPLFEDMYDYFYEKCGSRDFYSVENFRRLLDAKKLLLVLDGMDEIPTEESVRKFLEKIGVFYESNSENMTLLFTGRNEKDAEYITFRKKTVRKFRLNQLSDDGIKELGNNLFLMFGNEDKGNEFYVRVKELNDEIKSNPLLLSQLAIVYNDSGVVPQTIVGIFDAISAIILKRDRNKNIEIPQEYRGMMDNLSYWLAAFAAERYGCISRGKTVTALKMIKKLLKPQYEFDYESRAEFLLEYIRSRAIYIEDNDGNGEFYHKMFSEYFTAIHYYKRAFDDYSEIEDKSVISELFGHYSDPYWAKVLQLFLIKADSCIDKETTDELYKLILSENKIEEYTLLFDCCRDLIVHKQEAQTVLVCDILQKSADGVYPPYGPLFWYVPEYGLYETVLFAALYLKGNAKALALVRDVCYIYGQKNSIDAITEKISGQELFDAASPNLNGVRRALCEIFYLGDTKYEGGKDIYPRCFNVAETLSFRDCGCGLFGRMKTSFQDELGLYSHTSYNILKGGAIGLVSCPYDAAEIEKRLSGMENFKLRGLILTPTEKERFEFVNFTRSNVQVLYLPENIIGTDESFNRYMPLICDVCANKEGVSYLFGDVKLPPLYPVMRFSGCRTIKSVVIAEGVEEIRGRGNIHFINIIDEWDVFRTDTISCGGAFEGCSSLKEIKIPEGVKKIGNSAFEGCSSLQEIEIPEGVREIGQDAFAGCSSLQEIEIPEGVGEIGYAVFRGCSSLQKIEIPEGVKEIGSGAFKGCSSLQKIEIPEGVKEICGGAFKGCSSLQEIEIPEGVKEIGMSAFEGCSNLQKIEIPEGVKEIGMSAFAGCSSLQKIEIPEGVGEIWDDAFCGCSSLQKIEIPEGMKEIRWGAFAGCSSLKEITIPEGVKEIGGGAFAGCSSLKEITIPEGVREIGWHAFRGCSSLQKIEIPEGVREIRNSVFRDCSSLQKIEIPEGMIEIGDSVFRDCSSLKEITIPEGVREIGNSAFAGCSSLQKIEIPEGVKVIGESVFAGCRSLKKITLSDVFEPIADTLELDYDVVNIEWVRVRGSSSEKIIEDGTEEISEEMFKDSLASQFVIPSSVKKIGARAFLRCRRLKTIEISEGVKEIGYGAFEGCSSLQEIEILGVREIRSSAFKGCSSLQKIEIPEGVEMIPSSAFAGCSSLQEIEIPEGVKEIRWGAFKGCSSLQKIEIPEGVKEIGYSAFEGCSSLQKIEIPEGVRGIWDSVFEGCSSLKEITIPEGVREIWDSAFKGCSSLLKIKIPEGVEEIEDSAFAGCSNLKEIVIPQSVIDIGDNAFKGCTGLEIITIGINFQNDIQRIFGDIDSKIIHFI